MDSIKKEDYLADFEGVLGTKLKLDEFGLVKFDNEFDEDSSMNNSIGRELLKKLDEVLSDESLKMKDGDVFTKKNLIAKFIYEVISKNNDINVLDEFIENLQFLSNKTYEMTPCNMSFIVFQTSVDNIEEEVNQLQLNYIPFEKKTSLKDIVKLKEPLKLIDSKSLSYVVTNDYMVVGLAKKIKSQKSIFDRMTNRNSSANNEEEKLKSKLDTIKGEIEDLIQASKTKDGIKFSQVEEVLNRRDNLRNSLLELRVNKEFKALFPQKNEDRKVLSNNDIHFVQISSHKVEWFIEDDVICILSNGKWKVLNYKLILNVLTDKLYTLNRSENSSAKQADSIFELFQHVKKLSSKNIGALIVILKEKEDEVNFEEMLAESKLKSDDYRKIVRNEKEPINIFGCDKFLFELITSLDGATILDNQLNIIGFGEFIDNRKKDLEGGTEQFSGSRTIAASRASRFGLSIKISEDGDVSIYHEEKLLLNM